MIIAITSKERTLQSEIDPRFGRAAYFMIANTLTGEVYAHDNSKGIEAANGAGTGAAQLMAEYKINILYTGVVGPKAADVLNKAGIKYVEKTTGTVEQILDQLAVDDDTQQAAGGQEATVEPPTDGATRLAVPADTEEGMSAPRSGHFGKCNYYMLVDIKDNQVVNIIPLKNGGHTTGGCFAPVMLLKGNYVSNLVVAGIGGRPLQGFRQSGIEVFGGSGQTVQETVDLFLGNQLQPLSPAQVCGGGA